MTTLRHPPMRTLRLVDTDRLGYEAVRLALRLPDDPRLHPRIVYRWRWPSLLLIGAPIVAFAAAAGGHLLGMR